MINKTTASAALNKLKAQIPGLAAGLTKIGSDWAIAVRSVDANGPAVPSAIDGVTVENRVTGKIIIQAKK